MYSVSVVLKCNWFLRGIICYLVDGLLNFCKIIHGWIRCWERLQCQKLIMEIMIFHHFSFRIVLNLIYWAFKSLSKLHISIETFKNRLKNSFNMRNIFIPQIIMFSVILNQTPSPHIHPPPTRNADRYTWDKIRDHRKFKWVVLKHENSWSV